MQFLSSPSRLLFLPSCSNNLNDLPNDKAPSKTVLITGLVSRYSIRLYSDECFHSLWSRIFSVHYRQLSAAIPPCNTRSGAVSHPRISGRGAAVVAQASRHMGSRKLIHPTEGLYITGTAILRDRLVSALEEKDIAKFREEIGSERDIISIRVAVLNL